MGSATATVTSALLTSIVVTPATASIATGQTQSFTASGIFSDGSTTDITNSVTWNSSATSFATIDATGLATGVSAGAANDHRNFWNRDVIARSSDGNRGGAD